MAIVIIFYWHFSVVSLKCSVFLQQMFGLQCFMQVFVSACISVCVVTDGEGQPHSSSSG